MTPKSISRRVYRAILAVSVVSMLAMVATVLLVNEDLEQTMLDVEFAQERDFILANDTGDDDFVWDTKNLAIVFVPSGKPRPKVLPRIFQGLPDNHSAEIELDGETYLVKTETVSTGILYIAKNITHFEDRETLFTIALLVMTLVIITFSLLLAVVSSRRIVKPLRRLSERISRTPVGANMPRMKTDYVDAELHAIATTFNRFLDELESYVRREQSLLSLASHELRTPIAVMSGALDIIELRDQLNPDDRATLARVRRACDEMRDNVNILLRLARREPGGHIEEVFDVRPAIQQVIDDLKISHQAGDRVILQCAAPLTVKTDPAMVRMLLRNLVQNALQHTASDIHVTVSQGVIEIEDKGLGLNTNQQSILLGQNTRHDGASLSGLGLYIVTLMTERLGWRLDIARTDSNGTRIRLIVSRDAH
ncbi:HAMP domain-containing histidine kinase [Allopusillimonas soli]|uniref:histidine kinase n=1 Tax=Allopusillimonas soli TaxID=659016 RepID=A0A853F5T9_9BURK|nr:HAMP domain-containing sensor histidine kinase [Allopusillimonas soli]NYT35349.1 HAMP domain-containing histidine kinase [Allopusillimonas soli]TEA75769.1 HAMP domain-containing histidine kinase [Allopusillimonas soli]